jgi:hypothetical protein
MGRLDRFIRCIPGHLQTTYRLDFLDQCEARVAIHRPARECEVEFADKAAALLVTKLGKVLVARPSAAPERSRSMRHTSSRSSSVVRCRLWMLVEQAQGDDFSAIGSRT